MEETGPHQGNRLEGHHQKAGADNHNPAQRVVLVGVVAVARLVAVVALKDG